MVTKFAYLFLFTATLTTLSLLTPSSALHAQNYRELFKKLDSSVVTIHAIKVVSGERGVRPQRSVGSGVVVSQDGEIMTAAHVVHTADQILVKFVDGTVVPAQIVSSVPGADVALIEVEKLPSVASVAVLGDSDKTAPGEPALVIGAPFGIEHSLSVGHVSGSQTRPVITGGTTLKVIQIDAAVNHGNSGGPLFNDKGELIGIVSHILSEGGGFDGIGFAVATNAAKTILLDQSPIWTGFEGVLLSPELSAVLNVPQGRALLVQRVNRNSIAAKAGLQGGTDQISFRGRDLLVGGDIILEIQNTVCDCPKSFENLSHSLKTLQPGESIKVKVFRAGKVVELYFVTEK